MSQNFMIYVAEKEQGISSLSDFISKIISDFGYATKKIKLGTTGNSLVIDAESTVGDPPVSVHCYTYASPMNKTQFTKAIEPLKTLEKGKKKTNAMLISLSGFANSAIDLYAELEENIHETVRLITPEDLIDFACDSELIEDIDAAIYETCDLTPYEYDNMALVISRLGYFYILKGSSGNLIMRSDLTIPTDYEYEYLKSSMSLLEGTDVINIKARREIIIYLSDELEPVTQKTLENETGFPAKTVKTELERLVNDGMIAKTKNRFMLDTTLDAFVDIFKEISCSNYIYDFMCTPYFTSMNSSEIAEVCLTERNITPQPAAVEKLNRIFSFSPSALYKALFDESDVKECLVDDSIPMTTAEQDRLEDLFCDLAVPVIKDLHSGNHLSFFNHPTIVGLRERFDITLASSVDSMLRLDAGRTILFSTFTDGWEEGTEDDEVISRFREGMAAYFLEVSKDEKKDIINELENLFETGKKLSLQPLVLAKMANNISVCHMRMGKYNKAGKWLEQGLNIDDSVKTLHDNFQSIKSSIKKK